ncbi:hypothetical protein CRE_30565 [Caenorhabditis remanei]|uniref:Uncharacterized protein n=1 Tax=Caenorhabditis remanei TaxID=31234 RepID=E3NNI1_CAERE|nr:hypothetical protein CRE_30565 [Caenorhabditis remanei]
MQIPIEHPSHPLLYSLRLMIFRDIPTAKPSCVMLIFWILFPAIVNAATCPACPTGGMWSEWVANGNCAATCGACANLTYARTCLSSPDCPCNGANSAIKPCGTQACNYPRSNGPTKPCCDGSTPIVYNNLYHCGTVAQLAPISYCCPDNGTWSAWSAWKETAPGKIEYTRNRICVSSGYGCQCVGESAENKFECPCPPLKQSDCVYTPTNKAVYTARAPQYHAMQCKAVFLVETSSFRETFYDPQTGANNQIDMVTTVMYKKNDKCYETKFKTYEGAANSTDGQMQPVEFKCDIETMTWTGTNEYTKEVLTGVTAIGQYYTPKPKPTSP